jgi:hypothetical protein
MGMTPAGLEFRMLEPTFCWTSRQLRPKTSNDDAPRPDNVRSGRRQLQPERPTSCRDQRNAPMPALATAMYHSGKNPLKGVRRGGSEEVETVKGLRQRRLDKAFLRYHDPENWPLLREALKRMGRADLIGPGKHHLVPAWQPTGTGKTGGEGRRTGGKHKPQKFLTKGVHR